MDELDTKSLLEAILFVAESPVPVSELAEVTEESQIRITELLAELGSDLDAAGRGITLREVAGGWRLYAHPDAFPFLERYASTPTAAKLSAAALETLSVVAYRQPVSRSQAAEIRGVDSDSSLRTLERRGLIKEVERLPLPGNPATYGTTELFLEKLGLRSLADLPPLADHVPPSDIVETLEETFRPHAE